MNNRLINAVTDIVYNNIKSLQEKNKKRSKKKKRKPKPNKYQRSKYKARAGTRRGDTMARLSDKIRKGKKLTKADYKARDDSEAAERKKKGYKTRKRFDTGMYISERKKIELDNFVEMIYERKKRKKKSKKKVDGSRSVKSGADKNHNVTRMDFLPDAVLKKIASEKKLDEFVEMLDERKKRRKKRKKARKKKRKSSAGKLSAATKETLKKKAKRRGLTPSSVYAEYRKGLAAYYSSGSRKGMTAHQWAHARVNSANPSKSWAVVKKAKGGKKKK